MWKCSISKPPASSFLKIFSMIYVLVLWSFYCKTLFLIIFFHSNYNQSHQKKLPGTCHKNRNPLIKNSSSLKLGYTMSSRSVQTWHVQPVKITVRFSWLFLITVFPGVWCPFVTHSTLSQNYKKKLLSSRMF